jgi:hypothetical protein
MKNLSLAAGIAIILTANTLALIHAARNRVGSADAELTMTNRELRFTRPPADENSGVTLYLQWTTQSEFPSAYGNGRPGWLDQQKLEALGFDCRLNPTANDAAWFYRRQRPRKAFVALEYDGPAWRTWLDTYHQAAEQRAKSGGAERDSSGGRSHLVAIDAGLTAETLRARYPSRSTVIIVPAVISIALETYPYPGRESDAKAPPRVEGNIQQLASAIHVPRPLSDSFQGGDQWRNGNGADRYSVHLHYGSMLEPWVTGVELGKP